MKPTSGMGGGLSSGDTHDDRSNSMNSSAFSCADSSVVDAAARERLLAGIGARKSADVNVADHDAAALLLGGAADRRVEREVLHHGRVLVGVVAVDPLLRHGQERRVDAVLGAADDDLPGRRCRADVHQPVGERDALGEAGVDHRGDVDVEAVRARAALGDGRPRRRPSKIQALCQCEPKMRPPASAKSFTAWRIATDAPPRAAVVVAFARHQHDVVRLHRRGAAPQRRRAGHGRRRRRWSPARRSPRTG